MGLNVRYSEHAIYHFYITSINTIPALLMPPVEASVVIFTANTSNSNIIPLTRFKNRNYCHL